MLCTQIAFYTDDILPQIQSIGKENLSPGQKAETKANLHYNKKVPKEEWKSPSIDDKLEAERSIHS